MSDESPEKCTATCRDGSGCEAYPLQGRDKCRMHAGTSAGGESHENNGNAETHTLRSDPGPYYERQSDAEQERIDEWAGSWARRGGYDGLGFDKLFHTHAVKLHQVERADEHIGDEGTIISRVVDRTESGEAIVQDEENPAFLLQSRAIKDITRFLKEMGCLDDPDSQQANATESVAAVLGEQ